MAKGTQSKEAIFQKMLDTFSGSFMQDNKTLRIPMMEDGSLIEIKVSLTAAKDILGDGSSNINSNSSIDEESEPISSDPMPTPEEKQYVIDLLDSLNEG